MDKEDLQMKKTSPGEKIKDMNLRLMDMEADRVCGILRTSQININGKEKGILILRNRVFIKDNMIFLKDFLEQFNKQNKKDVGFVNDFIEKLKYLISQK